MDYYDFTGRCPCCGGTDLWDDNLTYGCNNSNCGWSRSLGPQKKQPLPRQDFDKLQPTNDEE